MIRWWPDHGELVAAALEQGLPPALAEDCYPGEVGMRLLDQRSDLGLTGTDVLVIEGLWLLAYDCGTVVNPNLVHLGWIAHIADCSTKTVKRRLDKLAGRGVLTLTALGDERVIYDLDPLLAWLFGGDPARSSERVPRVGILKALGGLSGLR
jgi:hypothetical protein